MPVDMKRMSTEMISLMMQSGPAINPIYSKMNDGHIDKFIEMIAADGERKHHSKQSARKYNAFYALLVASVFIFVLVYTIGNI